MLVADASSFLCFRARAGGRTWRRAGDAPPKAAQQLTARALLEALVLAAAVYFIAVGVYLQASKALQWCVALAVCACARTHMPVLVVCGAMRSALTRCCACLRARRAL
jgi:hypothetical protein